MIARPDPFLGREGEGVSEYGGWRMVDGRNESERRPSGASGKVAYPGFFLHNSTFHRSFFADRMAIKKHNPANKVLENISNKRIGSPDCQAVSLANITVCTENIPPMTIHPVGESNPPTACAPLYVSSL